MKEQKGQAFIEDKEYLVSDFGSKRKKKTDINAEIKVETKELDKAIRKTKKLIKLLKEANQLEDALKRHDVNRMVEKEYNQNLVERAEILSNEICSKHIRKLIEEEKDKIRQEQYPEWEYIFGGVYNSQKKILRAALKELL